jgi:hypothetical protein
MTFSRNSDVEGHDVGIERLDRLARLQRIGDLTDHLDRRILLEDRANQRAHRGGIINHQGSNHVHGRSPEMRLQVETPTLRRLADAGPVTRSEWPR